MKVKTILVSQQEPKAEGSPYGELEQKFGVKVDFMPFSLVEGVDASAVRKQKIDLKNYTALILNSKNAVDHYFRIADEMRFKVPDTMKYFCQTETIAYYLQKYVVYRKRKIYIGGKVFEDVVKLIKKHRSETFLMPTSDSLRPEIPATLDETGIKWDRAILYTNVYADLSSLKDKKYDILAFFTPAALKSMFHNFPDFEQGDIRIATFGVSTFKEAEASGLTVDIKAPSPEAPSMAMALQEYIKAGRHLGARTFFALPVWGKTVPLRIIDRSHAAYIRRYATQWDH